jgi:hypothetical protein
MKCFILNVSYDFQSLMGLRKSSLIFLVVPPKDMWRSYINIFLLVILDLWKKIILASKVSCSNFKFKYDRIDLLIGWM